MQLTGRAAEWNERQQHQLLTAGGPHSAPQTLDATEEKTTSQQRGPSEGGSGKMQLRVWAVAQSGGGAVPGRASGAHMGGSARARTSPNFGLGLGGRRHGYSGCGLAAGELGVGHCGGIAGGCSGRHQNGRFLLLFS